MRYFFDVWFKPWIELSAVDQVVMGAEVVTALFLFAFFKVYVIDNLTKKRN